MRVSVFLILKNVCNGIIHLFKRSNVRKLSVKRFSLYFLDDNTYSYVFFRN